MKQGKRTIRAFLRKVYQNNSMRTQFVLVYFLFVLIPTVVALLLMSHTMNQKLLDATLKTAEDMVAQISSNVSFQFQQMSNISLTISSNSSVRSILSRQDTDIYTDYQDTREIQRFIDEIMSISPGLEAKLYVDNQKSYSGQMVYFHSMETFIEIYKLSENEELPSQQTWICQQDNGKPPSSIRYLCPVYSFNDITRVISYLEVDMKYSNIATLLENTSLSDSSGYFIVDNSANSLYSSVEDSDIDEFAVEDFSNTQGVFQKGSTYYAYAQVSPSQWYIVYPINVTTLGGDAALSFLTTSIMILVLFAIFFLVVILCLVLIVTTHYDRKIQAVTASLAAYNINELEPNLKKGANNLDFLSASVNRLILKVKELTEQSVQTEINEKKAQLKAMQFQINPHFLYNALDTINWSAIKRGDTVATRQISLLAKYFRLVLNNGDINIHMSQELEFCRVYLQIQNEIHAEKFTFKFDTRLLTRDVILPKMSIQPIVENALIHGVLKQRNRKGHILVLVEQTDTLTKVKVCDNGVGFDVSNLQDTIRNGGKDGFGLRNIYDRLKLFLGTAPVFHFHSDENGTEVEITMEL